MATQAMQRAQVNGTALAYTVRGAGEPILFFHCGLVADGFAPLLDQPALSERYQLIHYHRAGYGQSARVAGPLTVAQQASDALALLDYLGVERAHLTGHSYGANVALQLALDAPARVQSLALLEPPLPGTPSDPAAQQYFMDAVMGSFGRYGAGDKAGAIDRFLQGAFQPDYRARLDAALPGAFGQAVADADTVFACEMPALQGWQFTAEEAARIRQPVLSVVHMDALWSGFAEAHDLIRAWWPAAETLTIPAPTHLLQIQQPVVVAEGLAAFFARHPLPVAASV